MQEARECDATVLFADLRGFTALAENREPMEVLAFLNRCFAAIVGCVTDQGGSVDKFLGDGLMAVFGLAGEGPDHVHRAVRAAQHMQVMMVGLRTELERDGWENVGLGVGLESGRVVSGTLGVPAHQDFTVVGDVVNVASRLTAGAAPGEVVLGPGAGVAVQDTYPMESLGLIGIRGRRQPVAAWRLRLPSEILVDSASAPAA